MTTPETGHPLLQALIDSISVFDGAACWDFAAMYAVRDALAAQAAPTTPDEVKRLTDEAKAWVDAFANAHAAKTPDPQWGVNVSRAKLALLAAIDALAAQAAPAAQPVAWMWQHPETGHTGFVENCTDEDRQQWERVNRPRVFICPLYASPQADTQPEEKPE